MSTSSTISATPAFPPPIPITYTWSTPNALRRLALPPLSTERAPSPSPPRHAHAPRPMGFAGPSRSVPVGARRPLPHPPVQGYRQSQLQAQTQESGQIPFPDPYAYQMPPTLVHHYQPAPRSRDIQDQPPVATHRSIQTSDHNRRPSNPSTVPGMPIALDLVPLVRQTGRLSFSEPVSHPHPPAQHQAQGQDGRGRERGRQAVKSEKEKKNGLERRISVSSIVARFTGKKAKSRSRSRSGSASRDHGRNLMDDE